MSKLETREKILTAAEDLFSRNGYDGAATKTIAKKAGVTEMTLYNHFANKQLLYKTLVKERFLAVELQSVFMELTYDDLEEDLLKVAEKLLDNFVNNRNILMMRLKERQSFMDEQTFKMVNDPLVKLITPVFDIYEKKGIIGGESQDNALLFATAVKGLFYVCLIDDRTKEDTGTMINHYIRTACYGMMR